MDAPESLPEALRRRLPDLMRAAIAEARRADQPFGCALADFETGALIGAAANTAAADPTAHAEVNGLHLLAELHNDPGRVALVSTAEPCPTEDESDRRVPVAAAARADARAWPVGELPDSGGRSRGAEGGSRPRGRLRPRAREHPPRALVAVA